MKKVLIATTALVASAGFAAADGSFSGSAEIGFVGGNSGDTQLHQDVDVTFSFSGETDGGVTFGFAVDLDESNSDTAAGGSTPGAFAPFDDGGVAVFMSGGFGTVTVGDTDGAMDFVLTEAGNIGNPGSIADNETSHGAYLGSYLDGAFDGDGQIVRYNNTFGGFDVAISVEQLGEVAGPPAVIRDHGWAVGFGYELDLAGGMLDLGLGHQSTSADGATAFVGFTPALGTDVTATGVSAVYSANGLSAGVVYTSFDFGGLNTTHIGIGAGYTWDALSLHINYGEFDSDDIAAHNADGVGFAAAYDLGGGAGIHLGINDNATGPNYSLGVAMSF